MVDCEAPCIEAAAAAAAAAAAVEDACRFCVCRLSELSGCDGWFWRLCVVGIDNGCDSDSPGNDSDGIRSIIMPDDLPIEKRNNDNQFLINCIYESATIQSIWSINVVRVYQAREWI